MRLEGKNFFDTRSILHRRKLILGGGATAIIAGFTAGRALRPRAEVTSASLTEISNPEPPITPFELDERAQQLREAHSGAQLWHEKTIVVFGADLQNGQPHFQTDAALAAVRRRNTHPDIISALLTDPNSRALYSTKASLIDTKEKILTTIRNNHGTPTTILFTAHGGPLGIQLGTYPNKETGETEAIYITPDEIADAYAPKYRSMRSRILARRSPDILAFVNCSSGTIADEFMTSLQRAEIEREPRRDLRSFQPTLPITFSASTAGEVSYINQLLFEMAEHTTVGAMYASADRIGGRQYSNPGIRVPDTETGIPVIVGATGGETRFA